MTKPPNIKTLYRSEGFALTGYVVPGCMEDGAWMLWENSSTIVVAVVVDLAFNSSAVRLDWAHRGEVLGAKHPQQP